MGDDEMGGKTEGGAGYWTHNIKLTNYHVRIIEVTVKLADDDKK